MRILLTYMLLTTSLLSAQVFQEEASDTIDTQSNAYIHEDWSYFAERLRNEFLALGERRYQRGEFQSAVMEYFSFLYHFPEDDLVPLVHYRIGRAYEQLGEFELAQREYSLVRDSLDADPRVQVVCLRQLARMDYELGHYQTVLDLPPIDDPYILVLKGFASLTEDDWAESEEFFRQARRFYPSKAQVILDQLIADIQTVPDLRYYKRWKRALWNLLPGGSFIYLRSWGEAFGYTIAIGTLGAATVISEHWTRYVMGLGAVGLYGLSFRASSRLMAEKNLVLTRTRLAEIKATYSLNIFWSFAHPAIY